jgi:hypothetical protein
MNNYNNIWIIKRIINKKVRLMNKKGFIMHPVTWILAAFILGFLAAYFIARGVIPIGIPICPVIK